MSAAARTTGISLEEAVSSMNMSTKNAGLIDKLRTWRRDASSLHQYEAAAFVGDKVLSITSDSQDNYSLILQRTSRMRSG